MARFLNVKEGKPPLPQGRPVIMIEREGQVVTSYHRGFRSVAVGRGESTKEALSAMETAMKEYFSAISGRLL